MEYYLKMKDLEVFGSAMFITQFSIFITHYSKFVDPINDFLIYLNFLFSILITQYFKKVRMSDEILNQVLWVFKF